MKSFFEIQSFIFTYLKPDKKNYRFLLIIILFMAVLPALEIFAFKLFVDQFIIDFSNKIFSLNATYILVAIMFFLHIALKFFIGVFRIRIINNHVTYISNNVSSIKSLNWYRSLLVEVSIIYFSVTQVLFLSFVFLYVNYNFFLIWLITLFISTIILLNAFGKELSRQKKHINNKNLSSIEKASHRLLSRIESAEFVSVLSSFIIYIVTFLLLVVGLKLTIELKDLLLVAFVSRLVGNLFKQIGSSLMRTTRAAIFVMK